MTMFSGCPTAVSAESIKSKKPEEWTHRFTQKLMSVVDALSVLYDGLEKDNSGSVADVILTDKSFPDVVTDFLQHCQNLVCMISEPTNGPVRLPLDLLLNTVSRCLRVAYIDVTAVPSMSELAGILPELHRATLEILSQLVLSCKTSVLPHSRVIIDLCMQALTSARHMEISERSKTRACAYRALCLLVQIFGWGKYMTRQCKSFIQELTEDINFENSAKQALTAATESSNKRQQDTVQGKKKGRKKKNKAESYVDLVKTNGTEDKSATDGDPTELQMIIGALELAKLMLGQVGFLSVESLMRCIVDTAQMFYHEEPPADSPYTIGLCRRELHAAVFACATVRLEPGCSRKDAITHFQLTNLALSILVNGMQNNCCYEVQSVCRESLNILQFTGSFNRPIIRRTRPQEKVSTIDETELEEVEKVREENGNLQSRLLDSDLEIQMHKNIEASLRKELETLKASRSNVGTLCSDPIVYLTDPEDSLLLTNDNDDLLENDIEQDESEDDETRMTQAETEITEEITEGTPNEQQSQAAEQTEQEEGTPQESVDSHRLLSKRKYAQQQDVKPVEESKRPRVDLSKHDDTTVDDAMKEMISAFVDTDSDAA